MTHSHCAGPKKRKKAMFAAAFFWGGKPALPLRPFRGEPKKMTALLSWKFAFCRKEVPSSPETPTAIERSNRPVKFLSRLAQRLLQGNPLYRLLLPFPAVVYGHYKKGGERALTDLPLQAAFKALLQHHASKSPPCHRGVIYGRDGKGKGEGGANSLLESPIAPPIFPNPSTLFARCTVFFRRPSDGPFRPGASCRLRNGR